MCGTLEVAIATRLGSEGLALIAAGENATHALELTMESQRVDIQPYQNSANHGVNFLSSGCIHSIGASEARNTYSGARFCFPAMGMRTGFEAEDRSSSSAIW